MKTLNDFTNLYSLSKTLRFELKPIGKTEKNIKNSNILVQDGHRAESYKLVKKIIDEYHRKFIKAALKGFKLQILNEGKQDSLEEYYTFYKLKNADKVRREGLEKVQDNLRKQIAERLTKFPKYENIYKKELIKEELGNFVTTSEEKSLIEEFKDFTTYFTGFYENRKNMYSAEEKSTAIPYRIINDNLPKFIDNMEIFDKVKSTDVANNFGELYKNFEKYLNVNSIEELFQLEYFTDVLTQEQIDVYNAIIGGRTENEGQVKIKGLNEYINLHNQRPENKNARLPKLKVLFKQILSEHNAISWLPEEIKSDNEVLENIEKCYRDLAEKLFDDGEEKSMSLQKLIGNLNNYDLNKIYIQNGSQAADVSKQMFGDWNIIQRAIEADFERNNPQKPKENAKKYGERKEKFMKSLHSLSIGYINECLSKLGEIYNKPVEDYFTSLRTKNNEGEQKENLFVRIANAYTDVKDLLNTDYPEDKNLSQDQKAVEKIKTLLDAIKELQWFVKPLLGKGDETDKDECFYSEFSNLWIQLNAVTPLYNKVRNYITRKPYSTEKIKLNFENKGQFLGGWVDSKTENSDNGTQGGGYLFRKKNEIGEYDYFLGISSDPKLFRKQKDAKGSYERLDYYQLKSTTVYGNSYVGDYEIDKKSLISTIESFVSNIDDSEMKAKINDDFAGVKDAQKTPSRLVKILSEKYWGIYKQLLADDLFMRENKRVTDNLQATISTSLTRVAKSKEYKNTKFSTFIEAQEAIDDLCKEKVFEYFAVSDYEMELAQNRDDKPLYLFRITNKDLSYAKTSSKDLRKSRGTDNLHTLYFKELMKGGQSVFDIGTGTVFYREKTEGLSDKPTHQAKLPIDNKNINNEKKQSTFAYGLVKNKRYTKEKYLFHLSIVQNYQQPKTYPINQRINEFIKENGIQHIIGIDRGERHLLYLTLIDMQGNLKKQFTLNEIVNEYNGNTYRTNYHALLDTREKERNEARKSWQTIETIKELKEGYLSQVIHKIAQLIVEYNAIVVLEDLNFGFMRGRQKVEKQVYQKFERMLIEKLNYLVDKKKDPNENGGLLHALQLTSKFESFQKLGKQSGVLFYIPAWNTSKMDPTTGFVNLFDTQYENIEKAKDFFSKFDNIRYNAEKDWFEFETKHYSSFNTKADDTKQDWTICTYGNRIETFRNPEKSSKWDNREIVLTDALKELFSTYKIDVNGNLKGSIVAQSKKEFFEELLHLLKLTLQMRNSISDTEIDYLLSPVMNADGEFYDSRTCGDDLPQNADANGAYNIARKGLWVVEQIKQADDLRRLKLAISNKEWLQFAQR